MQVEVPDVGLNKPVPLEIGSVQGRVDGPDKFRLMLDMELHKAIEAIIMA